MSNPIPLTTDGTGPSGAIPIALYGAGGASEDVETFLTSLPGYDPGNDNLVLGLSAGSLQWVDPSGQAG